MKIEDNSLAKAEAIFHRESGRLFAFTASTIYAKNCKDGVDYCQFQPSWGYKKPTYIFGSVVNLKDVTCQPELVKQ